jgi:hypothetical protein
MTKNMMVYLGIGSCQGDRIEVTRSKKAKVVGRKHKQESFCPSTHIQQ